jgi:hypothetical protein
MSDSQEAYERAYAQHREAHGPHGARPQTAHEFGLRLAEALKRHEKEAELGRRVLEILARHAQGYAEMLPDSETEKVRKMGYFVQVQDAARSLGLLPMEKL